MQEDRIIPFDYKNKKVRVVKDENGELWWVLADVCKVLEIGNPSDVKKRLDQDDLDTIEVIDNLARKQIVTIVNEFALYDVILMSRKPEARAFQYWITHEVLPAIRKTGSYSLPGKERLGGLRNITIKLLADETENAFRLAGRYGITGNQAKLTVNAIIRFRYDVDCLELLGITDFGDDTEEEYLTPTEIGRQLGCSAKEVNRLLTEKVCRPLSGTETEGCAMSQRKKECPSWSSKIPARNRAKAHR